ncbi:hypothetical protein DSM107007_43270 [Nostoc sp. PCC 7120 = FACHB-418]|nr:hypothetical protein DSM107007_43270 [Nostoc sp. PCC 7120 = FACHB-418]
MIAIQNSKYPTGSKLQNSKLGKPNRINVCPYVSVTFFFHTGTKYRWASIDKQIENSIKT